VRIEGNGRGKYTAPEEDGEYGTLAPLVVFGQAMMAVGEKKMMGEDDTVELAYARLASQALVESDRELVRRDAPEVYHRNGDLESLKSHARRSFNATIANNIYMTDEEVINHAFHLAALGNPVFGAALMLPAIQIRYMFAARWYEQTLPRVVWADSNFPEMLMATKADAAVESLVRPPWRAFVIDLPKGLLTTPSPFVPGRVDELVHVLVHVVDDDKDGLTWNFLIEGRDGCDMWRHGLSTEQLLKLEHLTMNPEFCLDLTEEDKRILVLVGRLIVGVCLTLSDPKKVREAKRTKKRKSAGKKRSSSMPMTRNFVVGEPIKLRCRDTLKEWVEKGDRKGVSPNVQTLVRGHWRMQPHGPQNSLRKLIHIEPFWRGVAKGKPTVTRSTEL
jgi:hypothetical protein